MDNYLRTAPHIRGRVTMSSSRVSRNLGPIFNWTVRDGSGVVLSSGTEYQFRHAVSACSEATAAMRAHWFWLELPARKHKKKGFKK